MADKYDFGNLSPIEFEALSVDLVEAESGLKFESFSEGPDGGIDGRHAKAGGDIILQAKHFKNSTWSDLLTAAKIEAGNVKKLNPSEYYFITSQRLTPNRSKTLCDALNHPSVTVGNIWGRTKVNALLQKHGDIEKRNIKLWLSSTAVLERLLNNDIAIFTEGTHEEIERILKVFVANPSLVEAASILRKRHCLIISGPPGVGKTTLAQVLAANYCDEKWELVAMSDIGDGLRAYKTNKKQVFIFDDFLGKIMLDNYSLANVDARIARFFSMVGKNSNKRFILTTRGYIIQQARDISEAIDDKQIELSEIILDLTAYTREIKAHILYNHLYHSGLDDTVIQSLLSDRSIRKIIDHRNYMPRIVQWMTDYPQNADATADDYSNRFMEALDNPHRIWDKAFNKHINAKARVLLFCMYFSEIKGFPNPGINLRELKIFFDRALNAFGLTEREYLGSRLFEDTLRIIKSSFVTIGKNRVNFINPSVQDFLASEVLDARILSNLSVSAPTVQVGMSLWKVANNELKQKKEKLTEIAQSMLDLMQSDSMEITIPLHRLVRFVSELCLTSGRYDFLETLRKGNVEIQSLLVESKFPSLIDDLSEGRLRALDKADAYARLLKRELFRYLSNREFAFEVEELGNLAQNLSESHTVFSESFLEAFKEAAEESIECLDVNSFSISERNDVEGTVSEWLDSIRKIENYYPDAVDYWKKTELEEFMQLLEMRHQHEMESMRDARSLTRAGSQDKSNFGVDNTDNADSKSAQISDRDLSMMFSTLKRPQ